MQAVTTATADDDTARRADKPQTRFSATTAGKFPFPIHHTFPRAFWSMQRVFIGLTQDSALQDTQDTHTAFPNSRQLASDMETLMDGGGPDGPDATFASTSDAPSSSQMPPLNESNTVVLPDQVDEQVRAQWEAEQDRLKRKLVTHDDFPWPVPTARHSSAPHTNDPTPSLTPTATSSAQLKYIGGVDISFVKDNARAACSSLVVLSFPELEVMYEDFELVQLTLPYIPGFLAFREVGFLVKLLDKLKATQPQLVPQVIFVDGNGVLHPKGFGLASHLGVLVDIPTVGIGKTFFHVDGLDMITVRARFLPQLTHGGMAVDLVGDSGHVWGAALRSTSSASNPVFVSVGHRIALASAVSLTKCCCLYRVPEAVRQADLRSREFLRNLAPRALDALCD